LRTRRPNTALPLFLFAPAADRWDPAVRAVPNLWPGQPHPPPRAAGRYRPGPSLPAIKTAQLSRSEAPPSFPLFKSPVTALPP
jgi:hypothetical protein